MTGQPILARLRCWLRWSHLIDRKLAITGKCGMSSSVGDVSVIAGIGSWNVRRGSSLRHAIARADSFQEERPFQKATGAAALMPSAAAQVQVFEAS
ncbi:MAG: hypothetical protein JNL42_14060 [Anaerolineae bacterium]|nr:hypothetical protein [Anaerolineae bacterium]